MRFKHFHYILHNFAFRVSMSTSINKSPTTCSNSFSIIYTYVLSKFKRKFSIHVHVFCVCMYIFMYTYIHVCTHNRLCRCHMMRSGRSSVRGFRTHFMPIMRRRSKLYSSMHNVASSYDLVGLLPWTNRNKK